MESKIMELKEEVKLQTRMEILKEFSGGGIVRILPHEVVEAMMFIDGQLLTMSSTIKETEEFKINLENFKKEYRTKDANLQINTLEDVAPYVDKVKELRAEHGKLNGYEYLGNFKLKLNEG